MTLIKFFALFLFISYVFAPPAKTAEELELNFLPPCPPSGDCAPVTGESISAFIIRLYQFGVGIAGILAVGMIVAGAIYRIANAGSPDKQNEGNDMIKSAVWGLVLLLGSYLILKTVNPRLVELQDPTLEQAPTFEFEGYKVVERAEGESELPPLSTDQSVIDFCNQIAPGNPDCLRGDCHIYVGPPIGCSGYVPLGNDLPMKSGQCRWAGQRYGESYCVVRQQTFGALSVLNLKIPGLYEITEAYPPTARHSPNGGHYNGCSVDIKVKPRPGQALCDAVNQAMTAASESGFTPSNEYPACNGKFSERATGAHIHLRTLSCP